MHLKELLKQWELGRPSALTDESYSIRLPVHDVARLLAFTEMYPNRTDTQIITDLLRVALDGVEEALPYIQGNEVIGEDECGDPIYNDVGPTPLFFELKKKYSELLAKKTHVA
ncbi:MAG: type 1 pili tip component [Cycloclasticus sp.]|nr:type 1 pili tip component [Cycloclasticus sp.]|tara:strand:+ start:165 stop:503 length:339 start_codon:yes stop_codon:yes gene_type:complete